MRLSAAEVEAITRLAARHFGAGCEVRLFGSRVDNARRGGDIDLHVVPAAPVLASLDREPDFLVALKEAIGDQRIDLAVQSPGAPDRAIDALARETG
jgi:predicted nucleotidyltransferase